jgi:predicted negative regulator of RcsB-dependent stress response
VPRAGAACSAGREPDAGPARALTGSKSAGTQKEDQDTVDQQTKAALKKDKFVTTTSHGLEWASENRRSVIVTTTILLAVIVIAVLGGVIYNSRSDSASVAFGAAMQAYQTPLLPPGQAAPPGIRTYATMAERAKAANALFMGVVDKYGMTPDGRTARYFAGLTYIDEGDNQSGEAMLQKVAGSWDTNLAALAKLALAQLYQDTGRGPQAIDLLNQLKAKPTATVSAGLAQLQLAALYQSEGKTADAKKIYADLKQDDAKGPAGMIAAEKLNPAAAPPPQE